MTIITWQYFLTLDPISTASQVRLCRFALASSISSSSNVACSTLLSDRAQSIAIDTQYAAHKHMDVCCERQLCAASQSSNGCSSNAKTACFAIHSITTQQTNTVAMSYPVQLCSWDRHQTSCMSRVASCAAATSWSHGRVSPLNTTFQPAWPSKTAAYA